MDAVVQLLDYATTYPNAEVSFKKSDMILKIYSDASYLSEYGARSRVGGYFFMGNNNRDNNDINGPIVIECALLKTLSVPQQRVNWVESSRTQQGLVA